MGVEPPPAPVEPLAEFDVWPCNWQVVQIFRRLGTQWRTSPLGGIEGLRYAGVESVLGMLKIEDTISVLDGIQVMERAALEVLNGS